MRRSDWEMVRVVAWVIALLVLVFALVVASAMRLEYVSTVAEIEQLRADVQRVDIAESEDVIGQVTTMNRIIARWQRQNEIPIFCLLVPNGWRDIVTIELPERNRR